MNSSDLVGFLVGYLVELSDQAENPKLPLQIFYLLPPISFVIMQANGSAAMIATGTISAVLRHKGSEVWSVPPDTKVFDAIVLMSDRNVGALLVMEGHTLLGVISERDYTRKVAIKGKSSKQITVREILPEHCPTATPNHTVEDCMRMMTESRVRHLPILEGCDVVGIVSIGDLVNWIISAQSLAINQLEQYITGQYPSYPS